MKVAVVGATGLVGSKMLQVLEERNFPVTDLIPVASDRSAGKKIEFRGKEIEVVSPARAIELRPDIALFSAGGSTSLEWAPKFRDVGCVVIDNSSAWRMHADVPLIVPEVNAGDIPAKPGIIANPNCSTIQMVVALKPLHDAFTIKRVVVSTYQSVTGTGVKAVKQLMDERIGVAPDPAYPYPIDLNIIPQIDVFLENGYTKEEMKMILETRKIMHLPNLAITSTTVRIPVIGGHSESINIEFENEFELSELRRILENAAGITVMDNPEKLEYPMPLQAHEKDDVFVGRIRRDESRANSINLWVVSDNLRKGAATNAVQIAELIFNRTR
ncbi:MAG: aspartate-semialdehyde dehydrogenase [Bacteroidia bacterium]